MTRGDAARASSPILGAVLLVLVIACVRRHEPPARPAGTKARREFAMRARRSAPAGVGSFGSSSRKACSAAAIGGAVGMIVAELGTFAPSRALSSPPGLLRAGAIRLDRRCRVRVRSGDDRPHRHAQHGIVPAFGVSPTPVAKDWLEAERRAHEWPAASRTRASLVVAKREVALALVLPWVSAGLT